MQNSTPDHKTPPDTRWRARIERLARSFVRGFHAYASWLVSISWKRFFVLSLLLLVIAGIVQSLPPFSYKVTIDVDESVKLSQPPETPTPPKDPVIKIETGQSSASDPAGLDVSIDERGIRIRSREPVPAASAAPGTGAKSDDSVTITLPGSATKEIVQEAIDEARQAMRDATDAQREAKRITEEAARDPARAANKPARRAIEEARVPGTTTEVNRTRVVQWGDFLTDLALLWIVASIIIKITYKGRMQAEVKAAQAAETAEAESLRRQVVEARMVAMQAQVEPHFLFNTLASIDHLIETDPLRASRMQKNLIALLRASMPTMREASDGGPRALGRELEVIRPYLEILKMRMEERLATEIDIPQGLYSAEFPSMMIQTLVENAIRHGLEPKPDGGSLKVKAEIVHGKLAVSVADTGLGFGQATTAGTGVGLANVRERLQLLYGTKASLAITSNAPSGTIATITVPYNSLEGGTPA
jgi:signal transduction histidine kinase